MGRKRVAVVGSGAAGIGAVWALSRSTEHDIHLFEADTVLGGHTNTVTWRQGAKEIPVDTGFIVYNVATYPNFIQFLKHLSIDSVPTAMTFGVSRDAGAFEWAGTSLSAVFAQKKNIFSMRMWRMLFDIVRFNMFALDLLASEDEDETNPTSSASSSPSKSVNANGANGVNRHHDDDSRHSSTRPPSTRAKKRDNAAQLTIGEYLQREGYSDAFRDDYLIPMTAAVWSTSPDKCALEFPAVTLVRFMWNHHLLTSFGARPDWMTIPGGSQRYIDAVMQDFPKENVHLSSPVVGVEDINDKVILQFENGDEDLFDHAILACHGDQAMSIISDGSTEEEREILGSFHTTENIAYLHSDLSLMPRRRVVWSAWNLFTSSPANIYSSANTAIPSTTHVTLTYNMNILQHIPTFEFGDVLVTLNPPKPPAASTIQGTYTYQHPLYTSRAITAQKVLHKIQNTRGISYCGAWTKYGFHEDALSSGLRVACDHLGAKLPWDFVDSTFSRGRRHRTKAWGGWTKWEIWNGRSWSAMPWSDWAGRWIVWLIQLGVLLLELVFGVIFWPLGQGKFAQRRRTLRQAPPGGRVDVDGKKAQ